MTDLINNNDNELNNNELEFLRDFVKKTKEKAKNASKNYYNYKYVITDDMTDQQKEKVNSNK